MATLGIKQSAWQAATELQQRVMRMISEILRLGNPALYTDGIENWFVFDDHRYVPDHVAYLGAFCANSGDLKPNYTLPADETEARATIRSWLESPARKEPLVLTADIVFPENDPNPWQTILDAQAAPVWIRMGSGIPDGFTAVEEQP